jgi:hypothetical protein
MSVIRVKDSPNLVRDTYSKAIINTDPKGYNDYVNQRERLKAQQEILLNNTKEIENLKQDVNEIKSLLQQIATNLQGKV